MGQKKRSYARKKAADGRTVRTGRGLTGILLLESVGATVLLAWIFYDSVWGCLLFPAVLYLNRKRLRESERKRRRQCFDREFKEMLMALSAALQSGYSIENAFRDAEANLRLLYGKQAMILEDVRQLNGKVAMRVPVERAFGEFAQKYPTEEALGFSQVFGFARRLGGDYVKNLRRTTEKMEEKLDVRQEMETAAAEKQMELKIMSVMPAAILLYVKLSSGDFLSGVYHTPSGMLVMTACIGLYAGSILLGKRIAEIEI